MALIAASGLTKRFRRPQKDPGLAGAVRHVLRPRYEEKVAVADIDFLAQNLTEFTKFPITLYDRLVRGIISWVVPFACVSYSPALLLLGRPEASPWMAPPRRSPRST